MVEIVTRAEWGARPPTQRTTIAVPTGELILHHLAAEHHGASGVRDVQAFHIDSRGLSDIAYSFLVDDPSGTVYEGRGAGILGGHTRGHNRTGHAICGMGDFEARRPSRLLIESIARLVAHGARERWWPGRITHGHRQLGSTACPGRHLFDAIPDINALAAQYRDGLSTRSTMAHLPWFSKAITSGAYAGRWPSFDLNADRTLLIGYNGVDFDGARAGYGVTAVDLIDAVHGHELDVDEAPDGTGVVVRDPADGGTFFYRYRPATAKPVGVTHTELDQAVDATIAEIVRRLGG